MGIGSKLKKAFKKYVVNPIKSVVDTAVDTVTTVGKVILSPFTGAFNIPDFNIDTGAATAEMKGNLSVDFNGANRAIPVLYGQNIDIAGIPIFCDTWGSNSADTTKQYLYIAYVFSQGYHGSNQAFRRTGSAKGNFQAECSRLLINGQSVHLGGQSQNYGGPHLNYITSGTSSTQGGIFATGRGGNQPPQITITKGTFANRLVMQYFDGSSDQPVSSLLSEHPSWGTNKTLAGMHYMAFRFELKAADEVISGSDGNGTFGNPYSGLPSVVATVTGRNTPVLARAESNIDGWTFKSQGTYSDDEHESSFVAHHKNLKSLAYDSAGYYLNTGSLKTYWSGTGFNVTTSSNIKIHFEKGTVLSSKYDKSNNIAYDLCAQLSTLGFTDEYVYFAPGTISHPSGILNINLTGVSDDMSASGVIDAYTGWFGLLFKKVGTQYQLASPCPVDIEYTILTTGGFHVVGFNPSETLTETQIISWLNGNSNYSFGSNFGGAFTNAYFIFGNQNDLFDISLAVDGVNYDLTIEVYNRRLGTRTSTRSSTIQYTAGDEVLLVQGVGMSTVPYDSDIMVHLTRIGSNNEKEAAHWDVAFASGYDAEGVGFESYRCTTNPVSALLDYLLNPAYGAGLSLSQLDKNSFEDVFIACEKFPSRMRGSLDWDPYFKGSQNPTAIDHYFDPGYTKTFEWMWGPNVAASPTYAYFSNTAYAQLRHNGYDRQFIIDTGRTHQENINLILSSFGGYMPYINGKFYLYIENAGDQRNSFIIPHESSLATQLTLTEDNLIDNISIGTSALNDRFNQVKIDYADVAFGGQPNSEIVPSPILNSAGERQQYLDEDNGKSLEGSFAMPSIFDQYTANRWGKVLLKKSRGQPILNLQTNAEGYILAPGDFIRITSSILPIDDVYRVTESIINYNNTVTIQCIRHDVEIYDLSDGADVYLPRSDIFNV